MTTHDPVHLAEQMDDECAQSLERISSRSLTQAWKRKPSPSDTVTYMCLAHTPAVTWTVRRDRDDASWRCPLCWPPTQESPVTLRRE